jgi:serine/threonine protein kinase
MSLLSKLNHPSIITLYELFAHGGKYYVVMEYCRGGTMA